MFIVRESVSSGMAGVLGLVFERGALRVRELKQLERGALRVRELRHGRRARLGI